MIGDDEGDLVTPSSDGDRVGFSLFISVGVLLGEELDSFDGEELGFPDGKELGFPDGKWLGLCDGKKLGFLVASALVGDGLIDG